MTVYWILFLGFWGRVAGDCDVTTGPPGGLECIAIAKYNNKYQWGTCLSDAYIKENSGAAHQCEDQTAVFCYYQCMHETHNISQGPVYDDCACDPSSLVQTTSIPLPAKCYSPDGTDCSWYRDCLETKYSCSQTGTSYAIDYGEKFCNLYTENYYNFTEIGRQWIDAVRKCLQVALVPLIRQYKTASCSDVKKIAFASHSGCYTSPFPGAPSVCYIGPTNWRMVFTTISPAFSDDLGASTSQLLKTAWQCGIDYTVDFGKWVKISIISAMDDLEPVYHTVVRKIQNFMKGTSSANEIVISPILPEQARKKRAAEDTVVKILFLSRAKYDLNYNGNPDVNVTAAVVEIMNAIEKGEIYFGSEIRSVSQCDDFNCTNSSWTVIPPKGPINGAPDNSSWTVIPPKGPINGAPDNSSWTVIHPKGPINGAPEKQINIPVLISSAVIWVIWSTVKYMD